MLLPQVLPPIQQTRRRGWMPDGVSRTEWLGAVSPTSSVQRQRTLPFPALTAIRWGVWLNWTRRRTSPLPAPARRQPVDWWNGGRRLTRAGGATSRSWLSVGYAACHWCHVMAHESFAEDPGIAALLKRPLGASKPRGTPDVTRCTAATTAMTGHGGWPMMGVLGTHERRPFYAGTYHPPEPRSGHAQFPARARSGLGCLAGSSATGGRLWPHRSPPVCAQTVPSVVAPWTRDRWPGGGPVARGLRSASRRFLVRRRSSRSRWSMSSPAAPPCPHRVSPCSLRMVERTPAAMASGWDVRPTRRADSRGTASIPRGWCRTSKMLYDNAFAAAGLPCTGGGRRIGAAGAVGGRRDRGVPAAEMMRTRRCFARPWMRTPRAGKARSTSGHEQVAGGRADPDVLWRD